MNLKIAERVLEDAIECALLFGGPDACPPDGTILREPLESYGSSVPGGYRQRSPNEYDRGLCLISRDVLDFIYATQPKEWEKLKAQYGDEAKDRFLKRLAREIETRGALDVLRRGIKDAGVRFELAYYRPSSGLNPELQKLYEGNLFTITRPGPLQREEREQPGSGPGLERHPDLHGGAEEHAERPDGRARGPAVPLRS